MVYVRRFTSFRRGSSRFGSFRRGGTGYRSGTRFVARRYNRPTNGREVPYYLGRGIEAHVFDCAIAHSATGTNGNSVISSYASTLLNPITRGTGIFDRESQRASMKYVLLRLRYQLQQTSVSSVGSPYSLSPITVRILLVYATRPIADLTVSDFIITPNSTNTDVATAGVQRIDSRENFQILYDNKFVLRNTNTTVSTAGQPVIFPQGDFTFRDVDLRLPIRRPVSFTASSTSPISVSDITSGALYLLSIFDGATGATVTNTGAHTTGVGSCRLVFAP